MASSATLKFGGGTAVAVIEKLQAALKPTRTEACDRHSAGRTLVTKCHCCLMNDHGDSWWVSPAVIALWVADRIDLLFEWDEGAPDRSWDREQNWYHVFHGARNSPKRK